MAYPIPRVTKEQREEILRKLQSSRGPKYVELHSWLIDAIADLSDLEARCVELERRAKYASVLESAVDHVIQQSNEFAKSFGVESLEAIEDSALHHCIRARKRRVERLC